MSMKRAFCIHCKNVEDKKRIFEVNTEAKVCFCPRCMHKYAPINAVNNYNRMINKYLIKANYFLKNAMIIDKAYALFAYILEIEPNNLHAKIGRIVSLMYLSSLRRDYFLEAKSLIEVEKDRFHGVNIAPFYQNMILEIDNYLDTYKKQLYKKLTIKDHFFDIDCVQLFFEKINHLLTMKQFLLNEAEFENMEALKTKIADDITSLNTILTSPVYTFDGEGHILTKVKNNIVLTNLGNNDGVHLEKYHRSSLNYQNHKIQVINDKMFKTYRNLHYAKLIILPISFVNLLLALGFLVTYFVTNAVGTSPSFKLFALVCLYITIFIAVISLFGFVSNLLIRRNIKKTRI